MVRINRQPTVRTLRQFAYVWILFFGLVGALALRRTGSPAIAAAIWGAATAVAVAGLCVPPFMRLIYLGMSYATFPIGWAVSHLVLALVYYAVITPVGLSMKLLGRDPLQRKFDPEAQSYWIPRSGEVHRERYFRQF